MEGVATCTTHDNVVGPRGAVCQSQIRADQALARAESQINWAIERAEVAIDGAHLAVGSYADTGRRLSGVVRPAI